MSKLRARLANNNEDRRLHEYLAAAEKSLIKAEEVCGMAGRVSKREANDFQTLHKAQHFIRQIRLAMAILNNIGYLKTGEAIEDVEPKKQLKDTMPKKQIRGN